MTTIKAATPILKSHLRTSILKSQISSGFSLIIKKNVYLTVDWLDCLIVQLFDKLVRAEVDLLKSTFCMSPHQLEFWDSRFGMSPDQVNFTDLPSKSPYYVHALDFLGRFQKSPCWNRKSTINLTRRFLKSTCKIESTDTILRFILRYLLNSRHEHCYLVMRSLIRNISDQQWCKLSH